VAAISAKWLLTFTALFIALAFLSQTTEPVMLFAILMVSILLSFPLYKWVKKKFVRPIVVWDIHGVFITGDIELEDLHEIKGTKNLIARVRNNHYTIAFTNFNQELFAFYSKKWGWFDMYDELYNSGSLKARKPTAEAFERFGKRAGISKKDIVFIDDRGENVDAARKLGIKSVQFKNPEQCEKALNDLGVKTR